jgi:hypothetical protein
MESEKGELKHLAQKEIWQVHPKVTCARVNQHFILQTVFNLKHAVADEATDAYLPSTTIMIMGYYSMRTMVACRL